MKHGQVFAVAIAAMLAAGTAQAQLPSCAPRPVTYYAAPVTTVYAAPPTAYYARPSYVSYYPRAYVDPYTPPSIVYGPAGVSYRTSSYTGYYPAFFPPAVSTAYYSSYYGGPVVSSTSSYSPGSAYFIPSNSNTPGINAVYLTIGDFHY